MLSDHTFTKEKLDHYLKELAKEFRRQNGKSMPVDEKPVPYYEGNSAKIVLEDGTVVSGDLDGPEEAFRGFGYVSHFATCPKAGKFRRKP